MAVFLITFILSSHFFLFSQQVEHFLFQNGLVVEVIHDNKNPVAHIQLEILSGYRDTQKHEAGYFDIARRLFWIEQSETVEKIHTATIFDTTSQLLSDRTLFAISFPAHALESILVLVKENARNTFFSAEVISHIQKDYLEEQSYLLASPYGIIHGLVMNHMYIDNPWAQSADMNYFYFTQKEPESLAFALKTFKENYYQPQNAKLTITSPFETALVLDIVQKNFSDWYNTTKRVPTRKQYPIQQNQKHVILVSDGFPENLEQVILFRPIDNIINATIVKQETTYVEKTNAKNTAEINNELTFLAFALEKNSENIKSKFCLSNELALESEQYLTFSLEEGSDSTRFVSQYMSKKNKTSLLEKLAKIHEIEKEISFSNETIERMLPYFNYSHKTNKIDTSHKEKLLAEGFFKFADIEPYTFVLLHPKTLASYKQTFDTDWFIVRDTDLQKDIAEKLKKETPPPFETCLTMPNYTELFNDDKSKTFELKLSNSIPIVLNIDPNVQKPQFDFTIHHSAKNYDKKSYLIDTILLRAFESAYNHICFEKELMDENYVVKLHYDITKNHTRFSVQAAPDIIESAVYDFISLFTFFSIAPYEADILYTQIRSEERFEQAFLETQLTQVALTELFNKRTSLLPFYNRSAEITYEDIQKRLALAYNANGISLAVMGSEHNVTKLFELSKKMLSYLMKREQMVEATYTFTIPKKEKRIQLSHIFTSNIDAKDAGPRPLKLIPTTEFLDPAHVYLQRPNTDEQVFFDAILYSLCAIMNESIATEETTDKTAMDKTNTKSFSNAQFIIDPTIQNLSHIVFSEARIFADVKKNFYAVLASFPTWLEEEYALEYIRNLWIQQQSTQNTPSIKTTLSQRRDLIRLSKATTQDFLTVFEKHIATANMMWLISRDTKLK